MSSWGRTGLRWGKKDVILRVNRNCNRVVPLWSVGVDKTTLGWQTGRTRRHSQRVNAPGRKETGLSLVVPGGTSGKSCRYRWEFTVEKLSGGHSLKQQCFQ